MEIKYNIESVIKNNENESVEKVKDIFNKKLLNIILTLENTAIIGLKKE